MRPASHWTAARIPLDGGPHSLDGGAAEPRDAAEQARRRLGLTAPELDVLRLVAAGRNNHHIAAEHRLGIRAAPAPPIRLT